MEAVTKQFLLYLHRYGYYKDCKITVLSVVAFFGLMFFAAESFLSLVHHWENIDLRFRSLEDVNVLCAATILRGYLIVSKDSIYKLIDMNNEPYRIYGLVPKRKKAIDEHNKITEYVLKFTLNVVLLINVNVILIPVALNLYKFLVKYNSFSVRDIELPFEFWHVNDSYLFISVIVVLQLIFSKAFADVGATSFLITFSSVRRLLLDIRLLIISVEEIDEHFGVSEWSSLMRSGDNHLKDYVKKLVDHHSEICRKIIKYNERLKFFTITVLNSVCFEMCLLYYWIAEVDDTIILIAVDISQLLLFGVYVYVQSALGQKIIDQSEALRNTLYECPWIDKPIWFKKSLLIMMANAKRGFEISPYGFYKTSLNNFTHIMNASYSYFNLLRTVKQNK